MEPITYAEMAEASRLRPGCDKVEQYAEIQRMRLEQRRAKEDDALLYPHESTFDRVIREASERHKATAVPFRAHDSEIILAKAKCGANASDAELIASIRERREWEASHPNWLVEAEARNPKSSHGRPVEKSITEQTRHSLAQSRYTEIRG